MSPKATKITYWILIALFALAMAGDGFGGVTKQQAGVDVLKHLGYPIYFMVFMGAAKLLGVIAILQNKFKALKEWAFAGFAFTFFGAIASRVSVGDGAKDLIPPIVMLAYLFVTYFFWKKFNQFKSA